MNEPESSAPRPSCWIKFLNLCLSLGFLLLLLATTGCLLKSVHFLGDRCVHFTAYWAVASAALLLLALALKRNRKAAVLCVLLAFHLQPLAMLWISDEAPTAAGDHELTVVSANLYANNLRRPEAVATLLSLDPDVLLLLEVSKEWAPDLKPLLEKYPHHLGTDGSEWMLSRHPLMRPERIEITADSIAKLNGSPPSAVWDNDAFLKADIEVGGKSIRVLGIHPPIPGGSPRFKQQFAQVSAYRSTMQAMPQVGAQLIIGDFNTTAFSSIFNEMKTTLHLRNAAAGYGYRVTWGPRLPHEPILPWLGIPIDHALVSHDVQVVNVELGETPGSDHRWQRIRLKF